jgi:exodeoxyribonuclease V alpha subunit
MKQLHALAAEGFLAPIDVELGSLLARRAAVSLDDVADVQTVALAGALLSAERGRGHSCLDLAAIAGQTHGGDGMGVALPDLERCRSALQRSGLCADGAEPSPLVLEGERLYLYRFHAAERRLAEAVRARIGEQAASPADVSEETTTLFRACFDVGAGKPTDWQAVAAAAALRNRLSVITGGPGTGKTYTVARVLALLLSRDPSLRIVVAAPTGKAAARLAEALREGAAKLPIPDGIREAIPRDGQTLHRLLGYQPWADRFTHGPGHPLAEDVIVVDEASMVDLLMMDAVFAASRPTARVILLGDQDQLASVDTGYVLGDICRAADACGAAHGAGFGAWYERLSGQRLEEVGDAPPLRDAVVRLRRSFRFEKQPGIGALAESIRAGEAGDALAVLASDAHPDVSRREPVRRVSDLLESVMPEIEAYFAASTPEEALKQLGAFRVLCALRDGPHGVTGLNDAIERWLRQRGFIARSQWYDRRPVLVTANDHGTGLYNGDVGVTFHENGSTLVYFPVRDGVRGFAPARVPAHATAWAMTVHKSQGSEFDRVLLVLPEDDSRVLTRELLYTGVTRARKAVTLFGSPVIIRAATARTTVRASGLAARLSG